MGTRTSSGSLRRARSGVGFSAGLRFSSPSSSSSSSAQDRRFRRRLPSRDSVLAGPEVVSIHSRPSRGRSASPTGSAAGDGSHFRQSPSSSPPSSRMEDFRRLHGLSVSDDAFRLVCDSWRDSSAARYDAVWRAFRAFLDTRGVSFVSVDIALIADYLSSLFSSGRAYRTITLHRSVLSAMYPPFDGHSVGSHPLISRVVKGVFQRRPPSRRFFPSWDVSSAFAVFSSLASPLDFFDAQRKCAFLLALASARRPSELASLRCDAAYMIINADHARFLPSRLSKTDRQRHLGPPIIIRRLPDDVSLCPVAAIEELLRLRHTLDIAHASLFSSLSAPYPPISVSTFSGMIRWVFRRAGISAPPGSTRATSVSDAVARGVCVEDALLAGDWSSAQTFFRHYLRPSASSRWQQ